MKTIGMIGGMSWESTLEYYRLINGKIREKRGGNHSGEIVMYSFDFNKIVQFQEKSRWDDLEDMMVEAGKGLKNAGADFLIICANTMHKSAEEVESEVTLPLIHIGDAVAYEIKREGLKTISLLGTKYVMEGDFYQKKLHEHGLKTLVPEKDDREIIHEIIYEELCRGKVKKSSRKELIKIIERLEEKGSEGIILGCTELPLLIKEKDVMAPIFNSTKIHSLAAVDSSLLD